MKHIGLTFLSAPAILILAFTSEAVALTYLSSAHGNLTYGVERVATSALGYGRGNCTHCHEQHASINGSEPAPTSGVASGNLLFADNYGSSQTDGFCFKCHTDTASVQTSPVIVNRSYSYRAGAWTADPLDDVKEAFSATSSHNLLDIRNFISHSSQSAWNYNSGSNPCVACHNPHAVQGDPANNGAGTKNGTGGLMLSLPSLHGNSPWALFSAKMSGYTSNYKAPYRVGGATYEPDGVEGIPSGANLTDFNTFCTDCHDSTKTINSSSLGRNLKVIDWVGTDRHGQATGAPPSAQLVLPYNTTPGTSYVLACTDCHEPHGSPNVLLIRPEVNGGQVIVTGANQDTASTQWASLCERCHGDASVIGASHHVLPGGVCLDCHPGAGYPSCTTCTTCHYHGSTVTIGGTNYRTF